ncbi:MAG: Dam family site-specific DNA-(adenine-N6)-methyltransferase [Patescibacteria group bacterium]
MSPEKRFNRSPFFYVGDKYKLVRKIKKHFPKEINTFVEPFLGGGSVFLNIEARHYALNDIDKNIISLHKFLISQVAKEKGLMKRVRTMLEHYNLSRSVFENVVPRALKKKWVKTYYAEFNRKGYGALKADYNKTKKKDPLTLYLLLIYGFNRMLRFNKSGEFNIPVGNVDFNQNVLQALQTYFSTVRDKDIKLYSQDFKKFIGSLRLKKNDFVYVDPPYLISASEYNKFWGEKEEADLLEILTGLNKLGIKFALSNITTYNGRKNEKLLAWMQDYNVFPIDSNYISYHDNTKKKITEVLITNY